MKIADLLKVLKAAVFLSLAVFLGMCSYFVWTTTQVEKQVGQKVTTVLAHADSVLDQTNTVLTQTGTTVSKVQESVGKLQQSISGVAFNLNQTIDLVKQPCVPGPCGTIADLNKTLGSVRGTVGTLEIAGHHWDRNLSDLDNQEAQLFQHTDQAVLGLGKATDDLNDLISDPRTIQTISNFQTLTQNLGQTTGDFQHKFHDYLYPPPCSGFKCRLSKTFTYIKAASSLAEPAYWGVQLYKAIP